MGLAIIWPRISLILGWSLAGATLLASMGVAAADFGGQNRLLAQVPAPLWAQATLIGCFVGLGSIIQWKLGPKAATSGGGGGARSPKKKPKKDDGFDED